MNEPFFILKKNATRINPSDFADCTTTYGRLSKNVFRYGPNTRFWLLQLREPVYLFNFTPAQSTFAKLQDNKGNTFQNEIG